MPFSTHFIASATPLPKGFNYKASILAVVSALGAMRAFGGKTRAQALGILLMLLACATADFAQQDFQLDAMDAAEAIHFRCRFAMEWFGQRFDQRRAHACNASVSGRSSARRA